MFSNRLLAAAAVALGLAASPASAGTMLLLNAGPATLGAPAVQMVSAIMTPGGSATVTPSISVTNYASLVSNEGSNLYNATVSLRQLPIAVNGTIDNLEVNFPTNPTPGSWAVSLNKAGSVTALTCTVQSGTQNCADTGNGHGVSVVPGDLLAWQFVPAATPTAQTAAVQMSATFKSGVGQESPLFGGAIQANLSTTVAGYLAIGVSYNNATEANSSSLVPASGTIDKLYIRQSASSGAGSYQYTLYKNGAPAPAGCTVGTNCLGCTTSGTQTCDSSASGISVSVAPTDLVSLQFCPSGGTGTNPTVTCQGGSAPTAGQVGFGLRWIPSSTNQSILMSVDNAVPATTLVHYMSIIGMAFGNDTAEAPVFAIVPALPAVTMTLRNLYEAQGAAPGGAITRAFTVRGGPIGTPADQAVTCTVGSAALSCNDTTHTYAPAAASLINYSTLPSGTSAALVTLKLGMVAVIQ